MERDMPKVGFGNVVFLRFTDSLEELRVCIQDQKPNLPTNHTAINIISPKAPLAQAIINRMEGEVVDFISPGGKLSVEIIKVRVNI